MVMAMRDIPIETMVTLVGAWVDANRDRPAIEKYAKLSPFLPDLDALHDTLLMAGRREVTSLPEELADVRSEIRDLDDRHDTIVRGIDDVLSGLSRLASKESTSATLESLRETLLPEGRRVVNWTLRRQGGAAERAQKRLSSAQKKALRELRVPGGTLLGFFNERVALARKLVELDRRRVALLAAMESSTAAVGTYEAMLAFVRTAGLFVAVAESAELEPEDRARILGGVEAALEAADARRPGQSDRALEAAIEDLDASAEAQPADEDVEAPRVM
jgi:hypothetical protein